MESVSLILIVVGAAIIAVVLLLRWGMRPRDAAAAADTTHAGYNGRAHSEFDPLFSVDTKVSDVSDRALPSIGKIVAEQIETLPVAPPAEQSESEPGSEQQTAARPSFTRRRPPRVAEDPHHVVVLNIMAGSDQLFHGHAIRAALDASGFEYGEWQIFHYYSPLHGDAPPLFSLANMVKPGSFNLDDMDDMTTSGLSLFMVPAGKEDDIVTFETMLAKSRQVAEVLGGEVRDARRSVLTRQAVGQIREQINEWRCKAHVVVH